MDSIEMINQEEITIGLNGDETLALMELIVQNMEAGSIRTENRTFIYSIVSKLGPGILRQSAKQKSVRDSLN